MKKLMLTLMIVLAIALAGCGSQSGNTASSPTVEALPAASQLILGTFKLEGTGEAVTAEQAAELLPLWQVYASLNSSSTAAPAELQALVEQIQESMTSSQMQAISDMGLTQADILNVMVEQNIVEAAPQQEASVEVSGGAPAGGPPKPPCGG